MGIGTVVAANGTWPREEIWKPLVEKADMLIALDGAGDRIQADLVLGDMDSISQIPNDKFLHLVEQNDWPREPLLKSDPDPANPRCCLGHLNEALCLLVRET